MVSMMMTCSEQPSRNILLQSAGRVNIFDIVLQLTVHVGLVDYAGAVSIGGRGLHARWENGYEPTHVRSGAIPVLDRVQRALKLRDRSSAENGVGSRDYRNLDLGFTCQAACRALAARLAVPLLQ